ncbi:hypothetical protein OAG56_04585 [Mariniblastus sp.]|jgi:hypothetical protein|nr:hypothetical protein [Mariniblastus sp.]MDB4756629.1 hypothetical protein [Mariniblastus sp.]
MIDFSTQTGRLIVVGGRQRSKALDLDEWHAYDTAVIAEVDCQSKKGSVVVEYRSPAEVCAEELPAIVFKAGDIDRVNQRLLVCTQTEIIEYDTANWERTYYFSHPFFNDLHHACYKSSENILLANTGLDQILEVQRNIKQPSQSTIVNQWNVGAIPTWEKFDQEIDYRKIATTKPHHSHPNFIFNSAGRWFATRFHQQDAWDLQQSASAFPIDVGNPHDGIIHDDLAVFTTTNGHLCGYDFSRNSMTLKMNLHSGYETSSLLGWCRGLLLQPTTQPGIALAWVGFSRIRPTWMRKNLSWIKQGFQAKGEYGTQPTRIACYRVRLPNCTDSQVGGPTAKMEGELLAEIDLEELGINAVFGIYQVD